MNKEEYLNLKKLSTSVSKYGLKFLNENANGRAIFGNKIQIALLIFIHMFSEFDGARALLCSKRILINTAQLQIRTMFECWVAISLIDATDDDLWSRSVCYF